MDLAIRARTRPRVPRHGVPPPAAEHHGDRSVLPCGLANQETAGTYRRPRRLHLAGKTAEPRLLDALGVEGRGDPSLVHADLAACADHVVAEAADEPDEVHLLVHHGVRRPPELQRCPAAPSQGISALAAIAAVRTRAARWSRNALAR